jgi:Protein of unknown function (DUF3108)
VFAFLMALVVAILLGLLMEVRVPAPLALGIAGATGWFLLRKLWPRPPDNTSVQDEAGDRASAKLLTRDVSRRVAAPPGSRGPRRVDPFPNRVLPSRWRGQLAQHGTCWVIVPVFNGSGLYNLRFTDIKRETLSADGYQNFAGPTQLCEVVRQEIVANRNKNEDTYRRGKIWYARLVGGDRMMPVRMEFDTEFGVVRGYLAELRGRGVDLHLMRE